MNARILALLVVALAFTACELGSDPTLNPPPVPAVTVRPAALTLGLGATDTLFAFVSGVAAGANHTIDWSAGDTTILRVTALSPPDHALVTGRQAGTTGVIASWHTDPTVRASATVMVR